ncbi:hypothetical protein NDU88_001283 [Pleurodeles waltl]|uniref:Uncharacterized protein n=1 Tax=Pleurodeles waltl TaxID=8319 RepID=A0AAV7SYR5_PLEWA|nr:hypothetical protein NDU88_001283 [Pleurodeles waltl]
MASSGVSPGLLETQRGGPGGCPATRRERKGRQTCVLAALWPGECGGLVGVPSAGGPEAWGQTHCGIRVRFTAVRRADERLGSTADRGDPVVLVEGGPSTVGLRHCPCRAVRWLWEKSLRPVSRGVCDTWLEACLPWRSDSGVFVGTGEGGEVWRRKE